MGYTPSFTPAYPNGWENLPSENTPVTAGALQKYDNAIEVIEDFLDGSEAVKPIAKTMQMTQAVGIDENGALFTLPGSSGGETAAEISYDNTTSQLTADDVQDAIDEVKGLATAIQPVAKTSGMTQSVGIDSSTGQLYTEPSSSVTPIAKTSAMTQDVGVDSSTGQLYTVPGVAKTGDTMSGALTVQANLSAYDVSFRGVASGNSTQLNGSRGHAEGMSTTVHFESDWGNYAHAEGGYCETYADYAHAEGKYTVASGEASHTQGYYTTADYSYQNVCGQYNDNQSNTLFEVGNGTSQYSLSNAFEVRDDGTVKIGTDIDCDEVSTMANSDYVYVSIYDNDAGENILKKITISNLKTVLGIS